MPRRQTFAAFTTTELAGIFGGQSLLDDFGGRADWFGGTFESYAANEDPDLIRVVIAGDEYWMPYERPNVPSIPMETPPYIPINDAFVDPADPLTPR